MHSYPITPLPHYLITPLPHYPITPLRVANRREAASQIGLQIVQVLQTD